jgi:hypothetical protein
MIRKLAICSVVALFPAIAFAAGTGPSTSTSTTTTAAAPEASTGAKADTSIKTASKSTGHKRVDRKLMNKAHATKTKATAPASQPDSSKS